MGWIQTNNKTPSLRKLAKAILGAFTQANFFLLSFAVEQIAPSVAAQ